MIDVLSAVLATIGAVFFLAGTVGVLRFPDVYCRLHALTKADNLGLGFVVLAMSLQAESLAVAAKLLFIWGLTLSAAATAAYLIANAAMTHGPRQEAAPGTLTTGDGGEGDGH